MGVNRLCIWRIVSPNIYLAHFLCHFQKTCYECKKVFCRKCVATTEATTSTASSRVTCARCKVLLQRPPVRTQLMDLRNGSDQIQTDSYSVLFFPLIHRGIHYKPQRSFSSCSSESVFRVKDLQRYLVSKKVNTKACKGKFADTVQTVYRVTGYRVNPDLG